MSFPAPDLPPGSKPHSDANPSSDAPVLPWTGIAMVEDSNGLHYEAFTWYKIDEPIFVANPDYQADAAQHGKRKPGDV
jgi:hypothetical protein